ncbi:MAG: CHAT domain-containing protein [Actinobacteria bacterium]|nr:CHAT domain-containing protein [Actinomycetota bacterium]
MAAPAGDVLEQARELRLAGLAHNSAGRPHRAALTLRRALGLLGRSSVGAGRDVDAVRLACVLTLAVSELATAGLVVATERLEEARVLAGKDAEFQARYQAQRGIICARTGQFAAAIADLDAVLVEPEWFTEAEQAALLTTRGMVNFELGRADHAESDFSGAADLAGRAGDRRLEYMATHNRGYARYLTGDLPGALAVMAEAEQNPVDASRGTPLYDLARVLQEVGLLDDSLETLDRAQAACRPRQDRMLLAEIHLERARILRLTGDFTEATTAARAARTRFERLGAQGPAAQAALVVLDCNLSRRRRLDRVLSGALASEKVAIGVGDAELRARSIAVAAEAAARLGRGDEAAAVLRRYPRDSFGLVVGLRHTYAAAVTDVARGRSPRRRLAAAASQLAASQATSASLDSRAARKILSLRLAELDTDLAVRHGPTDVLATLERWSSHDLPVIRPPADPRQAELTQQLRGLSQALRDEPGGPSAASRRAESERLERELFELGLAQHQADATADPLPPLDAALARLAASDRDLLRLFPHDGALWGVGVVGGRRRLERLADLDRCLEITRRLRADLRALAHQPPGALGAAIAASQATSLGWLDDTVVRPWRLRASGLVVIGTDAVASVPWGQLPSLSGVPVSVARSVSEWAGRRRRVEAPDVRVLTGPGLRFADAEGAWVAGAWPGARMAAQASSAELVEALGGADVVHVAAHGQHRPASPLFSSLRMADGEVFAHELPAGRVRAGHVVLSACDVGTAQMRPGDEPLGLANMLLALGVGSVVAAVAPVADDTTVAVMADYHAALAAGRPSDEALASAGRGAPFVVLGSTWCAS